MLSRTAIEGIVFVLTTGCSCSPALRVDTPFNSDWRYSMVDSSPVLQMSHSALWL